MQMKINLSCLKHPEKRMRLELLLGTRGLRTVNSDRLKVTENVALVKSGRMLEYLSIPHY